MAEWLMAPVLKTGIDKKTIEGSNPSLSFCFSTIAFTDPIKKKKRIARLYIAELQGVGKIVFEKSPIPPIWEIDGVEFYSKMIEVAHDAALPICVHSREAKDDTMEILKEAEKLGVNGVVHCYSYDVKTAMDLIDMGFYIGVGGVLTYKKADDLVETVTQIPLERIVLETDAPYLAPTPFRGKRNDSSYIKYVAEKLAELRNLKTEDVIRITSENARKIYPRLTSQN